MKYELKKAFSKRSVTWVLLILLLLGVVSCFFTDNIQTSISQSEYIEKYSLDIERVIKTAELNKKNLSPDSYLYKYQDEIIEKYGAVLDARLTPSTVSGYDNYILFDNKGIFLLIAVAIFGSILTLTEQDAKMTALNSISKRGKYLYRNKMAVSCFVAVVGAIFFSVAQLAVFAFRFGADGLFSPIVSIQAFALCPYSLTVIEYLIIQIGVLAVFACSVALISCIAGRFFGSYIVSIFAGLIPIGLYFFGESDFNSLFARYHALNIGGSPASLVNIVVAAIFLSLGALIAFMFLPIQSSTSNIVVKVEQKVILIPRGLGDKFSKLLPKRKLGKRKTLFFYEIKKLSVASLVVVVLLFGAKCYTILQTNQMNNTYENLYFNVCAELSGELTDEKETYIRSTLASANEIISKKNLMREQMMDGTISSEEYEAYIVSYNKAETDAYIFTRLETQANHILELRAEGKDACIVYETGWNELLLADYDLFLYLAVLLLLAGIYGVEQKNGMEQTIKTTKSGVMKLTAVKMICALSLTAILFIVFWAIDLFSIVNSYELPGSSYPAISLIGVSPNAKTNLIVYLIFDIARKMLGYLVFGCIICIASKMLKKVYFVIPIVLVITLLPHYLISDIPIWLDFLKLLA